MEEQKIYSLYRHTTPSSKVYIGITMQPVEYRWNNGKGYMNVKKGPFKSSILKYGWNNIKHEVLFTNLSETLAKHLEKELIRHYKKLKISLNVTDGGEGCYGMVPWNKGIKVPYELSNKRKGVHLTEEHKRKLSLSHKGKHIKGHKWSKSQKEKLSSKMLGTHRSEEVKKKISLNSANAKEVLELDLKGNIINTFRTIKEAASLYKIDKSWVAKACRNKVMCCGHIFIIKGSKTKFEDIKSPHSRKGKTIVIQDEITKEIKEFNSIQQCADFFQYSRVQSLKKRISKGKIIKDNWRAIFIDGKRQQSDNKPKYISKRKMICRNINTGEIKTFPSINKLREFLGLASTTSIQKALHGIRSTNLFGNWEIGYDNDLSKVATKQS